MSEDWIKKIVDGKEAADEKRATEERAQLERRRMYLAHSSDCRNKLAGILSKALEGFNAEVKGDPQKSITYNIPPHAVIMAHKGFYPAGDLVVTIDDGREKLICEYSCSRRLGQQEASGTDEYIITMRSDGSFFLQNDRQVIPDDKIAEQILKQYFQRIV